MIELGGLTNENLIDGILLAINDFKKASFFRFGLEMLRRIKTANNSFTASDVDLICEMMALAKKLDVEGSGFQKESPELFELWQKYTELKEKLFRRMQKKEKKP